MTSAFAIRMQGMEQAAYEDWVQRRNVQEIPLYSDPWNTDERTRMEMQGEMRDRNIHISKVLAIITAVAAAALAISGFLFSLSTLYFVAIAIGTVSLILLGTYCYLRSVQNALEANFARQKIRESIKVSAYILNVALDKVDPVSLGQIFYDDIRGRGVRDERGDKLYNKFQDIRGKIIHDVTRYIDMRNIDMRRAHTVDTFPDLRWLIIEKAIEKAQVEWSAWRPTID